MIKEEIVSNNSPRAIGPYSQAIKSGNLVFCSGQIGMDPKTNLLVEGGIKEQTKQVFENLKGVLTAVGVNFGNVVKVNVYLKNMDDFSEMNEIYGSYFEKPYPARATVEVAKLPKGALIEIECIACINEPAFTKAASFAEVATEAESVGKRGCCKGDCQCNSC